MAGRIALAFGDVDHAVRADHPEIEASVSGGRRRLGLPSERAEQVGAEGLEVGRMPFESVHDAVDAGRFAACPLPFREAPELPFLLGAASHVVAGVAQPVHEIVGRERVLDAQTPSPEEDDRGCADDARVVRPQVAGAVLLGRLPVWVSHAESVGRMPPVPADPHRPGHAHGVFVPDHMPENRLGEFPDDPCDGHDGHHAYAVGDDDSTKKLTHTVVQHQQVLHTFSPAKNCRLSSIRTPYQPYARFCRLPAIHGA